MQKNIVALHDPGGEHLFGTGGGWVVYPLAVGHDPLDNSSRDWAAEQASGIEVICRFQHGWDDGGCIPPETHYAAGARRIENFVRHSVGCRVWLIGNEMNHAQERPSGEIITPRKFARFYNDVARRIRALPGHEEDWILPGAIAPWNTETAYTGNAAGDWIRYFQDVARELLTLGAPVDAICLHAYTHGHHPDLIQSGDKMQPPWDRSFWHFREFETFLMAVPSEWASLPVLITETNPGANPGDEAWHDVNSGWVQQAYDYLDLWNQVNDQQIACLALYRWPNLDDYGIADKVNVQADFAAAVAQGYTWKEKENPPMDWEAVYTRHCNTYDMEYGDPPYIKVLAGYHLGWLGDRPEMDIKDAALGQPEVYEQDPPRSGVGFLVYKKFNWWMRTETPVQISAGVPTKLRVALMIVAHGEGDDHDKIGDCGMRIGISDPDVRGIENPDIMWMQDPEWRTVRKPGEPGANAEEYEWYVEETDEYIPQVGRCHVWIQCVANVAANISAGHFDLIQVLQKTDEPPPPPPPPPSGEYRVVVFDPDGNEVVSCPFDVSGGVNPQVHDLAQQIVDLTKPGG